MKARKLLAKALQAPQNLRFAELCALATCFGYNLDRIRGRNHISIHVKTSRPLNFQDVQGRAKPYQVKPLLREIEEFQLIIQE